MPPRDVDSTRRRMTSAMAPASRRVRGRGKLRAEFAGGEGAEGTQASGEFAAGQAALAVQPAQEVAGGSLALLGVAFQTAGDQVAVRIAARGRSAVQRKPY